MIAVLIIMPLLLLEGIIEQRAMFRMLSPHEQALRRATRPAGIAAVLLFAGFMVPAWRPLGGLMIGLAQELGRDGVVTLVAGVIAISALTNSVYGARRCWGVKDGLLATRAGFKLAFGAGAIWIWFYYPWRPFTANLPSFFPPEACFVPGIWFFVTGALRSLLLNTGGGNAMSTVRRFLRRTNRPLRPARPRRWWHFWHWW